MLMGFKPRTSRVGRGCFANSASSTGSGNSLSSNSKISYFKTGSVQFQDVLQKSARVSRIQSLATFFFWPNISSSASSSLPWTSARTWPLLPISSSRKLWMISSTCCSNLGAFLVGSQIGDLATTELTIYSKGISLTIILRTKLLNPPLSRMVEI